MMGDGLPTIGFDPPAGDRLDCGDHPRRVGDLPVLHRARPVRIGADQAGPVAGHRLQGDVELPVVEGPVESHDDVVHLGSHDRPEPGRLQLGDQRRLADHEAAGTGRLAGQPAGEDVGGVDDLVSRRRNAEPAELRRVVGPARDRLVGEEAQAAAGVAERADGRLRPRQETLAEIHRAVEVQHEPAVGKADRHVLTVSSGRPAVKARASGARAQPSRRTASVAPVIDEGQRDDPTRG
jgi:hypothetical protein